MAYGQRESLSHPLSPVGYNVLSNLFITCLCLNEFFDKICKYLRVSGECLFGAVRKARNRMNLYSAVCPICGKINQNLLLEETEGTMECESCGSVVNVLGMEDGNAVPILTKELCASIMARAAV